DGNWQKMMRGSVNEAGLGETVTYKVETAPANTLVYARLGTLRTSVFFRTSPQMVCEVLVDSFTSEAGTSDAAGTATWSAQIPNRTDLVGLGLKVQWFVPDPALPSAVMMSNAVELKIGR
ncbi:MAG: hypothetical protein KDB18_11300, partial [Salinibacterium sp.]|nr:hypothetical protein [Salinibacterium sp.]